MSYLPISYQDSNSNNAHHGNEETLLKAKPILQEAQ